MTPLVPDAIQVGEYNLVQHPTDPTALIVVDAAGVPVQGMRVIVGEAEAQGDVKHDSAKGPVVRSPDGTKYRITVSDLGVLAAQEV